MSQWIYDSGPYGLWVFLLVTVLLGGTTAWVTGKAIAETWRPFWQLPAYLLLLVATVRFLHYALFNEPLLTVGATIIDYIVLFAAGLVGYRMARSFQMSTQYSWLYTAAGVFGWRRNASN